MKCCTCRSGGRLFSAEVSSQVVTERYDVFQDEDYRRITREYQEEVRKSEEVIGRIENRCQSVRRARMNRLLSEEGGEVEIREGK